MNLVIISAVGIVHDADNACAEVRAKAILVPVTPLQVRVYKLAACRVCLPYYRVWTAARAA